MAFVQRDFRVVRRVDMSAGFVDDPDWVTDFDASGARAVGSVTVSPTVNGVLELVYGFEDGTGTPIASDPPTRLDIHVLILGSGSDTGLGSKVIYELEQCTNLNSIDICQVTRPIVGPSYVVFRVKNLVSPPGTAEYLNIAARVN